MYVLLEMQVRNRFLGCGISEAVRDLDKPIFLFIFLFICLSKIHMEMLGENSHELSLHLTSRRTLMFQRTDQEGNVNVLTPVTVLSGIL